MSKNGYNLANFNHSLIKFIHNVYYVKIFIIGEWPWPKSYNGREIDENSEKNRNFWMAVTLLFLTVIETKFWEMSYMVVFDIYYAYLFLSVCQYFFG